MATSQTHPSLKNLNFLKLVKRYVSCLGHGLFGVVLKAEYSSEKYTCLKFFLPRNGHDHRHELQIEDLPPHPNIVKVIYSSNKQNVSVAKLQEILEICPPSFSAYFESNQECITCVQMELCGFNLHDWINQEEKSNQTNVVQQLYQVQIVLDLISGLKFLHENNIIHGNLKPTNVLFSKEYNLPVKIGDIVGESGIMSEESSHETGSYIAPEVATSGHCSLQGDLYSLGLIIWEVVNLIDSSENTNTLRLVHDTDDRTLIEKHSLLGDVRKLIVNLTKRNVSERSRTITEFDSYTNLWNKIAIHDTTANVRNDAQLRLCLQYMRSGCTINLGTGDYPGGYFLNNDGITIIGESLDKTVIECKESVGIQVFASNCAISNVTISDREDDTGIILEGCCNKVDNIIVKFSSLPSAAIYTSAKSSDCTISNISGGYADTGIWLDGENHELSNIALSRNCQTHPKLGGSTSNNQIWDLTILAKNSSVKNSSFDNVLTKGQNTTLNGVSVKEQILIGKNTKGARLIQCKANQLVTSSFDEIIITDCRFDTVRGKN